MVEHHQDKLGGLPFEWKPNEKFFWYKMLNKLRLVVPLASKRSEHKGIWYTWCNFP